MSTKTEGNPVVAILMGSASDADTSLPTIACSGCSTTPIRRSEDSISFWSSDSVCAA